MEFVDLPTEMMLRVLSYLPAKSIACLSETCKQMFDLTCVDSLWAAFCEQEFNITSISGWDLTFKTVYTKILVKYPFLGLRRISLLPFGGLAHVVWEEGKIQVKRICPGQNASSDVVPEAMFDLTWSEETQGLGAKCVRRNGKPAEAKILQSGQYPLITCCAKKCATSHDCKSRAMVGVSSKRFNWSFTDHPNNFEQFDLAEGFNCPLLPLRSISPESRLACPLTPGLYKGDYGAHGLEILQVAVNEIDQWLLEGLKITGDPNVPAGNFSFKIHLDKPVVLPEEDQDSIERIMLLDECRSAEQYEELRSSNDCKPDLRQPFCIPNSCYERGERFPNRCLARYIGEGRIAGLFFTDPDLCKLHFVVFDQDHFGILWLDLFCFSVFHREKGTYPPSAL